MNYRHAFHAGNHADVLKHLVLLSILDALMLKPTPFFVLDTHAGAGRYALDSEESRKTGEAAAGIERLWQQRTQRAWPAALQRYLDAVAADVEQGHYPGSPRLIAACLRESDRLACCETQPEPASALKTLFAREPRVGVHQRDGYDALKALLPPAQKRGLVLIDPPYETQQAEFEHALDALQDALKRWSQGIYALWYPIKQGRSLRPVLRRAAQLPAKSIAHCELLIRPDDSPLRLNGSGMLLINPPWKLDHTLHPALHSLPPLLGENGAQARFEWLLQPP